VPSFIESDSSKIFNVLLNIIGNSLKYTTLGFIRIKISLKDDDNEMQIID
jgi:signal transduction histidine kinase